MRTGGEYREALRDGRRVWVMGEGWAGDVAAHPATRAMVEEYAAWYDRHLDLAWQEVLLARADADGERVPWAYVAPKGAEDLIGMGRSLLGAHTPLQDLSDQLVRHRVWFQPPHRPSGSDDLEQVASLRPGHGIDDEIVGANLFIKSRT